MKMTMILKSFQPLLSIIGLWIISTNLLAQTTVVSPFPIGEGYPAIKTWHEQVLDQPNVTKEQRLNSLREIATDKYGGNTNQIFDFDKIDPTIPGLEKEFRLIAASKPQEKGAKRTNLYAQEINHDPRYKLLAVGQNQYGRDGKLVTDKDIRFRHQESGLYGRIEVKDVIERSQYSNKGKYKVQMDKMITEGKRTGELQIWANRHTVIPELKSYAERGGILVQENVVTGKKNIENPNNRPIEEMMDDIDKQAKAVGRARAISGGAQTAFGAFSLILALPSTFDDAKFLFLAKPETQTLSQWLRLGENSTLVISGIAFLSSGLIDLIKQPPDSSNLKNYNKVSRVLRNVGIVGAILSEGFVVLQFVYDDMNKREFISHHAQLAGGFIGMVAGAKLGALAALWGGQAGPQAGTPEEIVTVPIAAIIGGVFGAFSGSHLSAMGVEKYYELKDEELEKKFEDYVFARYEMAN